MFSHLPVFKATQEKKRVIMITKEKIQEHKILILATLSGGYMGADSAGQSHLEYSSNAYILPVRTAAIFPPEFYLNAFQQGIDGIIIMYSGADCPYKGAPERTAEIINKTYSMMKERGLDTRRLRLAAICTVCVRPFLGEIEKMNSLLAEIGSVSRSQSTSQTVHAQITSQEKGALHGNG
jgi:F420-non-reducing hydrogenase iron-sulfur subunit